MKDAGLTRGPITRRDMIEKLLAAMAAGAAWPALASALDWKPSFLSLQQNETLIAVSESIVPGSAQAQVNRFIDLLLSVDTAENRKKFGESLAAAEDSSQAEFGRGFHQLSGHQKDELLTAFSASGNRKHFEVLKDWITSAYYSSEDGMRELGWTGDHAFRQYPQCP